MSAQMPDPSQMHGRAIPASDLPAGTVTVRLVRQQLGNDVPDQTVTLFVGNDTRTAKTDAAGRAEFPNLVVGGQGHAEATVDGEKLVSQPFPIPPAGGVRVILVAGLQQAAAGQQQQAAASAAEPPVRGTVVLGGDSRILMEFRDDALQVFYLLDIVNKESARVDIGGPLVIQLPTGAAGAGLMQGSAEATVNGDVVTVQGPFNSGRTSVQLGFTLRYNASEITVRQAWPVPAEHVTVAMERVGNASIASRQFANVGDVRAEDGTAYYLANGPALPANTPLTMEITGLPVHSPMPQYVGLGLAVLILIVGGWVAFTGGSHEGNARDRLLHRRDTLLGEVAQLEERRRAGALDAGAAARLEQMLTELEQIYGELDDASVGPRGGGEGLAA